MCIDIYRHLINKPLKNYPHRTSIFIDCKCYQQFKYKVNATRLLTLRHIMAHIDGCTLEVDNIAFAVKIHR